MNAVKTGMVLIRKKEYCENSNKVLTWSLSIEHMESCLTPRFDSQLPLVFSYTVISATAGWHVLALASYVN